MQAKYWLLTIPHAHFLPYRPSTVQYVRGQLERGESGYLHWQLLVIFESKRRLRHVISVFGEFHAEPSRSNAANDYVWKEDTRIEGTQFELGRIPFNRSNPKDWDSVKSAAQCGQLDTIPSDIYVRCYNSLRRITADHIKANPMERQVKCYWGATGTGKSRRAWNEASFEAYPKDPRSKFWDGYRGEENVVVDEFRGGIDISHILRWTDRYPVLVEVKGATTVLKAKNIYFTSNIHPRDWYPELDEETKNALQRRMDIVHFPRLS